MFDDAGERPSSVEAYEIWLPPDPATRVMHPSPRAGEQARHARRRGRALALAVCGAGLLLGAGAETFVYSSTHHGASTAASTVPASTVPASTVAPTPSTNKTNGQQASSQSDLTVGIVNIDTVLAYQQAEAAGTGIVLSSTGEVLTNNHVISGATEITVTVVTTGKSYAASVIGTDPSEDIAVLQLQKASGLAVARLGDSSTVKVDDAVVGVGNAGGRGTPTSASGTVIDLGRTITASDGSGGNRETLNDLIEISAALEPGDSGGPLYNSSGYVIGVDSAGSLNGRFSLDGSSGRGYAIPINDALAIAKQIEAGKATDRITIGTPPLLGIGARDLFDTATSGATVIGVVSGTPADAIGLKAGDVITSVGDAMIGSVNDLTNALRSHVAGDKVKITWLDGSSATRSAMATLVAGPAN